MNKFIIRFSVFLLLLLNVLSLRAQQIEADPHDFGRMWTFENPPVEWFQEAYNFDPGEAWFDHVRKSSLRFASWCSGSFVSPNGLIMTNHHCSRGVALQVQRNGEDFAKQGFYASTNEEERKVEGLYVEQLIKAKDITEQYDHYLKEYPSQDFHEIDSKIEANYEKMEGWENLRLQVISYYSGAKHSIYGYKRYNDIRLVLVPEVKIGFFGGEEDNFTYPRYNLDFTFWRAYNEDGEPLNTSENYLPFNPNGPEEGEVVFVIGNPASTERYKTVAQLEYDRDYRYPIMIDLYSEVYKQLRERYAQNNSPALMNQIFGLSNSLKVFNGILEGLNDKRLMDRKRAMEYKLRQSVSDDSPWREMEDHVAELKAHSWAMNLLGEHPMKGASFILMHSLEKYENQIREGVSVSELEMTRKEINQRLKDIGTEEDGLALISLLNRIDEYIPANNSTLDDIRDGKSNEDFVFYLFRKSKFYKERKAQKLLDTKPEKILKKKDLLLECSRALVGAYQEAAEIFKEKAPLIENLEKEIANKAFTVFGEQLPPDATFTLRLSDGVVKGYEYNGTVAPWKTTFFGMYDRYYSNIGKESWDLPEKWKTPNLELLKTPVNFVSTNDIIGGNSGSPIINKDMEVVGLIFDGNIESLPGNFIFDDEFNRSVSVHAGGILAALQYVYGADRIAMELLGKK